MRRYDLGKTRKAVNLQLRERIGLINWVVEALLANSPQCFAYTPSGPAWEFL
jgi:hypothetical protein